MRLLLFFLALTSLSTYSGGFVFPQSKYVYAKVYLFNVVGEDFEGVPDFDIYSERGYARSKIGDGFDLKREITDELSSVLLSGADELMHGLSGCYIPRHGIIYFDSLNRPVASMSICFECQRIALWEGQAIKPKDLDAKHLNPKKAEIQIGALQEILTAESIPVFDAGQGYLDFVSAQPELFNHNGTMNFTYDTPVEKYALPISIEKVKSWLGLSNIHFRDQVETKITAGGDEYYFRTLTGKDGTEFLFDVSGLLGDNANLSEAVITMPAIHTPWKVEIGMSLEEVQNSFETWDGIATPEIITVTCVTFFISYEFSQRTLKRISIRCY